MSNFGSYVGRDFLNLNIPPRAWLVEGIIKEFDSCIIVGNEKAGKSLFIFQLICSLTSCHPFLDKYNVPKPCKIVYIQLEGELGDSQDRMKRMIKTLDINPDLFLLMYYPPLELDSKEYTDSLTQIILRKLNPDKEYLRDMTIKPDIIIIDPIYFAFRGSLSDDEIVRKFIGNLRVFKDTLNCAIILVHHTHKQKWDFTGNLINEGDEALFGSKFFKAWADHTLLLLYDQKTGKRTLLCNTQRSGDIIKECSLRLIEPDPLYFEEAKDERMSKDLQVINLLQREEFKNGLAPEEIMKYLDISRFSFYSSIKKPLAQGLLIKLDGTRPIKYAYHLTATNT